MGAMLWTVIDGTLEKNVLSFEWEHFRVWSVIGRIGIAWGAAALLYVFLGRKARIGVAAAILVGMWLVMRFVTAPGAPAGVNPMEAKEWLFCNWIDTNFLTTAHRREGGFTTITMVATAMFGMFAGEILTGQSDQRRKAVGLVLFALGLLVSGLLVAFAFGPYSLPVNKPVWTSSFALVVGGISAGLLALFYWIIDIRGWRRWGFFFKVIGMNAITVYILVRTVFNWQFESQYFFGGIASLLPPAVGEFVTQAGMMAIIWLFLYWLYRKGIFLRV
jgi:predicted acyltransferase